jgi:hypothetical protein
MPNRTRRVLRSVAARTAAVGLCLYLSSLPGCGGSGNSITLATGRVISASADASIRNSEDTAEVRIGDTSVVIEPKRVLVNGQPVATLDPRMKEFAVMCEEQTLTITVDGVGAM